MKPLSLFFVIFLVSAPAAGQGKAVHFKKLQEFLPSVELPGFERKKPTGQTQSNMGMTSSEARVRYVTIPKETDVEGDGGQPMITIEVSISDLGGIPYGTMTLMSYQQDMENETEDGYERSVTVRNLYKGKESAQTGEYKNYQVEFGVGNRFLVKLVADQTGDRALVDKVIHSMNLAGLEKATP